MRMSAGTHKVQFSTNSLGHTAILRAPLGPSAIGPGAGQRCRMLGPG